MQLFCERVAKNVHFVQVNQTGFEIIRYKTQLLSNILVFLFTRSVTSPITALFLQRTSNLARVYLDAFLNILFIGFSE